MVAGYSTVPGYRILALAAEGGSTSLYKAIDERSGQTVALKIMHERFLGSDSAWQAFLCDLLARSLINAPQIPRVLDCGFAPTPYSVSSFVEGETLLQRTAPSDGEFTVFIRAAAELLASLHSAGLQPLDINPTNWIVTHWNAPSFVDFGDVRAGPSCQADLFGLPHPLTDSSLTEALQRFAALTYFIASGQDVRGEWSQFYDAAGLPVRTRLPLTHWRPDLPQSSALIESLLNKVAPQSRPISTKANQAKGDLDRLQQARSASDVHVLLPCGGARVGPFFHGSRFDLLAKLNPSDTIPNRFQRWLELHVATASPLTLVFLSPEHADPLTHELLAIAQGTNVRVIA